MAISKSLRFKIFHRDGFTCQYCGHRPPDVVLELDHVHPRAAGGCDDEDNLVTACESCNRGKSAKQLQNRPPKPDADLKYLETQQELVETERYLLTKRRRDELEIEVIESLQRTWEQCFRFDRPPTVAKFKSWLAYRSPEEIEYCIRIGAGKADYQSIRDPIAFITTLMKNLDYNRPQKRTN